MGTAGINFDRKILDFMRRLEPHQHVCAIHKSKREQISAAVAFLRSGLEQGDKCVYVANPYLAKAVMSGLRAQSIDVRRAREKGALAVFDKRTTYLASCDFSPDVMLEFFEEQYRAAMSQYRVFRLVGDVTWVMGGETKVEIFNEFEARMNDFSRRHMVLVLCQYDQPWMKDDIILNVLRTHPLIVYGRTLAENPYYIPPTEFLRGRSTAALVRRWLQVLQDQAESQEELRDLYRKLLRLRDEERRRIGRELHDTTGQQLAGLVMQLASLRKSAAGKLTARQWRLLAQCLRLAKDAARDISSLSYLLHPPMLDEFGLVDALRWYVRGFARRSHIPVSLKVSRKMVRLSREAELALFRVVQEALNNVRRHSKSRRAQIRLSLTEGRLTLEVRDFGRGFRRVDSEQPIETVGVGIPGMRERVRQMGGELKLHSTKKGTLLRGTVPLGKVAA